MSLEGIDFLLVIIPFILSLLAQKLVNDNYRKYSKMYTGCSLTGKEAALKFLRENNVNDVEVAKTSGYLSDHYDPTKKVIYLSSGTYEGTSVAALGVACHEAGHAIQHNQNYGFIRIRTLLVKPVQFANSFSWLLIVIGILLSWAKLFWVGIILFGVIALFQLVTLPVEINASSRAKVYLGNTVFSEEEKRGLNAVLNSAAFTYVVALLTSLSEILRLVLIFTNSNRD